MSKEKKKTVGQPTRVRSISISEMVDDWLDEHKEVKPSRFFTELAEKEIKRRKQDSKQVEKLEAKLEKINKQILELQYAPEFENCGEAFNRLEALRINEKTIKELPPAIEKSEVLKKVVTEKGWCDYDNDYYAPPSYGEGKDVWLNWIDNRKKEMAKKLEKAKREVEAYKGTPQYQTDKELTEAYQQKMEKLTAERDSIVNQIKILQE